MHRMLLVLALLASCSADSGHEAEDGPSGATAADRRAVPRDRPPPRPRHITELTGLYEGEAGAATNQLCIVQGKGSTQFGIVVWRGNTHSCSGSGTVTRRGDKLSFLMSGDSACRIDARISGMAIIFPNRIPAGCSYYCGASARLDGIRFTQTGTGRRPALSARDLVGDPLCLAN